MKTVISWWLLLWVWNVSANPTCRELITESQTPEQVERYQRAQKAETIELRYLQRGSQVVALMASKSRESHPNDLLLAELMANAPWVAEQGNFPEGVGTRIARRFPRFADANFIKTERQMLEQLVQISDTLREAIVDLDRQFEEWLIAHAGEEGEISLEVSSANKVITVAGGFEFAEVVEMRDKFNEILDALAQGEPYASKRVQLNQGHRTRMGEHLLSIYLDTHLSEFLIEQYYAIPGWIRVTLPLQLIFGSYLSPPGSIAMLSSGIATLILRTLSLFWISPARFGFTTDRLSTAPRSKTIAKNILREVNRHPERPLLLNYVGYRTIPYVLPLLERAGFREVLVP